MYENYYEKFKEEMAPSPRLATFAILLLPFYLGIRNCIEYALRDDDFMR